MRATAPDSVPTSPTPSAQHHPLWRVPKLRQALLGVSALLLVALAPQAGDAGHAKVERYSKAPEAEKISIHLLRLEEQTRLRQITLSRAAANTSWSAEAAGVKLDILTAPLDPHVVARIRQTGAMIRHVSQQHGRIAAVVDDPDVLYELARIPAVRMIIPEYGAIAHTGSVDGRASEALQADIARLASSLDGTGQTIGILSDSFARTGNVRDAATTPPAGTPGILQNSQPQRSGDLPPTVVLRRDDVAGSDEGAAMGELVHDIAPGALIAFYTAFAGQAAFADGITDLCTTAGATVVVDDVIYFAEPMYQDGIIAQAAAACVAAGVPYFSSAGNQANRGFRQLFADIATPDDRSVIPTGNDLHNWGNGDGFLDITLPAGANIRVILQWNQPFDSVSRGNGAQIDLDLYVTPTPNAAGLASPLARSTELQGVTGTPRGDAFETLIYWNFSSQPVTVYLAVEHFDGNQGMIPQDATTPLEFRLVFFENNFRGTVIQGIANGTSSFGGPTMYGHSIAPGVTSVAAVPWYDTAMFNPGFSPSTATDPEDFTSRGGTLSVLFTPSGAFAPRSSFEPDIAAVDGNNTTFFGSTLNLSGYEGEPDHFKNFFGTSAAAPNAAAVAAIIRELNGLLTPAEILDALVTTAVDVTGFRAAVGRDDVTGAGLINANAAIGTVAGTPHSVINAPTGNVTITQGKSLVFNGTGSSPDGNLPLSYIWDFGGGAPNSTLEDPGAVLFNVVGTFTVTFTVVDSQGVADPTPATLTVTVTAPMVPAPGDTRDGGGGGGGGGGCTMTPGAPRDFTLMIVLGLIVAYRGWKRTRQQPMC